MQKVKANERVRKTNVGNAGLTNAKCIQHLTLVAIDMKLLLNAVSTKMKLELPTLLQRSIASSFIMGNSICGHQAIFSHPVKSEVARIRVGLRTTCLPFAFSLYLS